MIKLFKYRRPIITVLMCCLLSMLFDISAFARTMPDDEIFVRNQDWTVRGDVAIISFDLVAPADKNYKVSIVLRRESDNSFRVVPKSVSGVIGEGKFAGTGREVRWFYTNDIPGGLKGNDYYFEIVVEPIGAGSAWLYYVLGGAAVAGGGAAYFILQGSKAAAATGTNELPAPPPRPIP